MFLLICELAMLIHLVNFTITKTVRNKKVICFTRLGVSSVAYIYYKEVAKVVVVNRQVSGPKIIFSVI